MNGVEKVYRPFVKKFIQLAYEHVNSHSIIFERLETVKVKTVDHIVSVEFENRCLDKVGFIPIGWGGQDEVQVRRSALIELYTKAVPWLEVLIYHELGHTVLRREHYTHIDSRGLAVSIMYPRIQPLMKSYKKNAKAMAKELFNAEEFDSLDRKYRG